RTKLSVLPHVGALNLWSARGGLINSSEMWPVADKTITDRRYFQEFMAGKPTPDVIVEPVVSRATKVWTTVFARKMTGRQGEIVGRQGRRGQVADALSDPHRCDHENRDRTRRLAGPDQAAIFCGGLGDRRRDRHGLPDRAPATPPACRRAAQAFGEEAASRHRHQQHDAGPAAVRFLRAPRDLQPAIYRHVRALDRRGQTRLPSERSDS